MKLTYQEYCASHAQCGHQSVNRLKVKLAFEFIDKTKQGRLKECGESWRMTASQTKTWIPQTPAHLLYALHPEHP